MRKSRLGRIASSCGGFFRRFLIVAVVLNMSFGGLFGAVVTVKAAGAPVPFSENFGIDTTGTNNVPNWSEDDGDGAGTKVIVSNNGSDNNGESPDGGRFVVVDGDGGWICREIDASDYHSLEMSYYWRGDKDANNSNDDGVIEYKKSGNCNDSSGWTFLRNHGLKDTYLHWSHQLNFSISELDGSSFFLRFRADSNNDKEEFRVDGISITGIEDDTIPPVIEPMSDYHDEALTPTGQAVTYLYPTANDNVDPTVEVTCEPATGSDFPMGPTVVTCNATDSAGNDAIPVTFNIIVEDTTPPEFIWDEENNPVNLVVGDSFDPTEGVSAVDNIDGPVIIEISGTVNNMVPETYYIVYTAIDNAENEAQLIRTVMVSDVNAPVINSIADITVEAEGPDGVVVDYGIITATDDVDGVMDATCDPVTGSLFSIGTTQVMCQATDTAGHTANAVGVTIIVEEPFIRIAGITSPVEEAVVSGLVSFDATLSDKDSNDNVQWAVRKGTCSAGTNTVFGNVDGFNNAYDWDRETFHAQTDTSAWEDGNYCFIFNPTESAGDAPIRETRNFSIDNTAPEKVGGMAIWQDGVNIGCGATVSDRNIKIDWDDSVDPNFSFYRYQADDGIGSIDFTTTLVPSERSGQIRDLDGTYMYHAQAVDSLGNVGEYSDWCAVTLDRSVPDTTSPVITLNGDSLMNLVVGDVYTEQDATALDDVDGVVGVTIGGDVVDTSVVGIYHVTYSASDLSGNSAEETRTVNVNDEPAPVISDETSPTNTTDSITITWTTDHPATSRVVYDTTSHLVLDVAPNYGYANSTVEDATLVTDHSVSVSGLNPGTTYYLRSVSHGSPESVSSELVVTTDELPVVTPLSSGSSNNGGSPLPPAQPTLGAVPVTVGGLNSDLTVELLFDVQNAAQMAISESPSFAGVSWETYQESKLFTLSADNTEHKLYIKFRRDTGGESAVLEVTVTTGPATGPIQAVLGVKITRLDELVAKLNFGDRNDEVREMQDLLKEIKFFPVYQTSTGFYWHITLSAVQKYLATKVVPQVLGVKVASIEELIAIVKYGERSENVRLLQDELKRAGFFPLVIDSTGYFGPITLGAVQGYQNSVK